MTEDQIISLLKTASAYDSRKPDKLAVLAWGESARRARWDFETAVDAIHEHYATTADVRIMPGHITAHHLAAPARPSDRTVDDVLGLPSPPISAERRAEFMAQVRKLADRKAIR